MFYVINITQINNFNFNIVVFTKLFYLLFFNEIIYYFHNKIFEQLKR